MTYNLFCLILGETAPFSVDINEAQSVDALKNEIRKKSQKLALFDAHTLTLYKIKVDISDDNKYQTTMRDVSKPGYVFDPKLYLNAVQEVSMYFEQISDRSKGAIHVLIEPPRGSKRVASEKVEPDTPSKRLRADHDIAVWNALGKEAPSRAAQVAYLKEQQKVTPILNGRPYAACGPPIIIFEQVFADFYKAMRQPHTDLTLSSDYYDTVGELLDISSSIFEMESGRQAKLNPLLGGLLDRSISVVKLEDGTSNDGICTVDIGMGHSALLLLCEFNVEIGKGECDPAVQAGFSFSRWWSQQTASKCRDSSCCASFLLCVAGPWVSVHGAILLRRDWIVQPLTDFIWTGATPDLNLDEQVGRVAQLFHTLNRGLVQLGNKYGNISQNAAPHFSLPYITSYSTPGANPVEFVYKDRLHCDDYQRTTSVFLAEDTGGNKLFVKFTSRYNEESHRLLAKEKYAPQLHHCSQPMPGCFMVVMDYIEGNPVPRGQFSNHDLVRVQEAKDILYKHGIVFGDLRPNNIVKPTNGSGVLLVDFDWCGKDGESRYPVTINNDRYCGWHKDVKKGTTMMKEHDNHLFESLNKV